MDKVFIIADGLKPSDSITLRRELLHSGIRPTMLTLMEWSDKMESAPEGSYALVMGTAALGAVLPLKLPMADVRGRWWKLSTGQWAMATYHPGVTAHGYDLRQVACLQRDMDKFVSSVVMQDLHPPTVSEYCISCTRFATYFTNKLGFCVEHTPRQRRIKSWTQLALDI